ncbi:MAG: NAD+ synthase [Solirubrobacterales bacterium]|nr:NAD+ synthase [Solirubrobacterales bacterium]
MTEPATGISVALAQIDPTVGDISGNARLIGEWTARAREAGADLVVFPELSLTGYPAEDLYLKPHFARASRAALDALAAEAPGIAVLVGFAEPATRQAPRRPDGPSSPPVHNSLALLAGGAVEAIYRKNRLPNYGVFDEVRYFEPGLEPLVVEVAGIPIGLTICEDLWEPGPPASLEAAAGAALIVNPSGSPYLRGKGADRELMLSERARTYGVPIAFCNLVGGQDELVFDGHSFVVDAGGRIVARARQFDEDLLLWELGGAREARISEPLADLDEVYAALRVGLRDYAAKNGFERLLVGLSGGIDSALVAMIAADAVSPQRLTCLVMPSPHSSAETQADARAIAANLGAEMIELPISGAMDAYRGILDGEWSGEGLAAENVQARIRGNLLMALSNDRGALVLTTGNKSEMSVGYATLYGDMAGGLAVIKDVPKQLVYDLVGRRNERAGRELVPASVLAREPSAELRADQRDQDTLPPYELLDRVLEGYVERDLSRADLVAEGLPAEVVDAVAGLVDRAEYKRRQAPPGIRITTKAFGRDRRLPITNRFRG